MAQLPFVWEGNGSLLIGTHHFCREDYTKYLEQLFLHSNTKTILIELLPSEAVSIEKIQTEAGHKVTDFLSEMELEKLDNISKSLDFKRGLDDVKNLKLYAIGALIASKILTPIPMEQQIILVANKLGANVVGLETLAEQLAILESRASERANIKYLRMIIRDFRAYKKLVSDVLKAFESGDEDLLISLSNIYGIAGHTIITLKRNKVMAERSLPYIKGGKCAVAIGAMHLIGKHPLQYFLKKRGVKSERIFV